MKRVGGRVVWSLPEVTGAIWRRFEDVPAVWVEAEVQNLRRRGAQVYFTLVDDHQIDASMNGLVFERLAHAPGDGTLVQAYGRAEFWVQRSQVRMRVERIEPAGEGLLLARIAELRERLRSEGLLDPRRKRRLPVLPRRIGLVTSADGAARQDFLLNLWARFPAADVVMVDVLVQGDAAPPAIVRALRALDLAAGVDVIVVARGGGSLEDLMAFNSEPVARAIAGASTPIVAAIGHERDLTIADEVADLRVSTPTAAAEAVVPSAAEVAGTLDASARRMSRVLAAARTSAGHRLEARARALRTALVARGVRADDRQRELARRLERALALSAAAAPARIEERAGRLERGVRAGLERADGRLRHSSGVLAVLSPRATVARGYAIVRGADGSVVASGAALAPGDRVAVEMRDATVAARVES